MCDIQSTSENMICDETKQTSGRENLEECRGASKKSDETLSKDPEVTYNSLKEELYKIVQDIKKKKIRSDAIAELIVRKKLNTMVIDLYEYDKGYSISFSKFRVEEIFHGVYSYGVPIIEYIKDGQIPHKVFDQLYDYKFKLIYDGYVPCHLRIHFKQEKRVRTHFFLLKPTIQTIDMECAKNCKADCSLDFETERARLICQYSPDLCLDPDPAVAEVVSSNGLGQHPFISPNLKHIIQIEKTGLEKKIKETSKTSEDDSKSPPKKKEDEKAWNFGLHDPTIEEAELSKLTAQKEHKRSILPYLKSRQMCFPDKNSFNDFHVEIENFVYEYDGLTREGKVESITDKLCISVLDDKEYYYGAYELDERMKDSVDFDWFAMGTREELDITVNAITKEELKLCCGGMKITHNRIFDEEVVFNNKKMKIRRHKLEAPVSRVVLLKPSPLPPPSVPSEPSESRGREEEN